MLTASPYLERIRTLTNLLSLEPVDAPTISRLFNYTTKQGKCTARNLFYTTDAGIMLFECQPQTELLSHLHGMVEWLAVITGSASVEWDGVIHPLRQYDVLCVPANTTHIFRSETGMTGWCVTMPADEGYVYAKQSEQ